MNGQSLVDLTRNNGTEQVYNLLTEGLQRWSRDRRDPEGIAPSMLSLRENALAFCGEQWYDAMGPGGNGGSHRRGGYIPIREANDTGDAVDVTAFSNITGQIVYYTILEAWQEAAYIGEELVETRQTDLDGEKMPWITPILSNAGKVHPGMPYPLFGIAEEWIQTVPLDTYGGRIAVHKLTVFYDRTGQVLKQAGDLGKTLRRNKEFRILDTLLAAPGSPLFIWKGVTYNPYQVNGTFWSNDIFSNQLVDWNSFRRVEVQASKVLEPDLAGVGVNVPIEFDLDSIVVMPYHEWDLQRLLHATELRSLRLDPAPNTVTIGGNVVKQYKPYISKILWRRAVDALGLSGQTGTGVSTDASQADELWFMFDSKERPLYYMQNWPLIVVTAPPNNPAEFERDIVFQARASERGNTSWKDPRYVFRVHGTAA